MMQLEKLLNEVSLWFASLGGLAMYFLGGWDMLLQALIVFIFLDYLTGILKGIYNKQITSELGFKGIIKKVLIIIMVSLANVMQGILGADVAIREIVIMFFLCNEGISILENASQMGLPIPQKIKDLLLQLRGEGNGTNM